MAGRGANEIAAVPQDSDLPPRRCASGWRMTGDWRKATAFSGAEVSPGRVLSSRRTVRAGQRHWGRPSRQQPTQLAMASYQPLRSPGLQTRTADVSATGQAEQLDIVVICRSGQTVTGYRGEQMTGWMGAGSSRLVIASWVAQCASVDLPRSWKALSLTFHTPRSEAALRPNAGSRSAVTARRERWT